MKYLILILTILSLTGCGNCHNIVITQMIPGHSTTEMPYTGPCSSTYNDTWDTYEVRYNDGTVGCVDRSLADKTMHVGGKADFCA